MWIWRLAWRFGRVLVLIFAASLGPNAPPPPLPERPVATARARGGRPEDDDED
jgi:hypothetical protein